MSSIDLHVYEVATTVPLSHEEKKEVADLLIAQGHRRNGAAKFTRLPQSVAGFVLKKTHEHRIHEVTPKVIREVAGNDELITAERVVGSVEVIL